MGKRLLITAVSAVLLAGAIHAQQTGPAYHQVMNCVKVAPGKLADFRQLVSEVSKPLAEARVSAGEIVSWTLLRSVMPAGTEARCDYSISTIYPALPPAPASAESLAASMKKAGIKMSAADYLARRNAISHLVATEMWRLRVRAGQPKVGDYVFLNHMKVHNYADYVKFETEVWHPLAEQRIKDGAMRGWIFATLMLPAGTDTKYTAYSADIYPNWAAAFAGGSMEATFKKAHPDKDFSQTMGGLSKLRDLAQRDMLVIEQRIAK